MGVHCNKKTPNKQTNKQKQYIYLYKYIKYNLKQTYKFKATSFSRFLSFLNLLFYVYKLQK